MTLRPTARKSADIPDAVFLQAVADTPPSNITRPPLPDPDGLGALYVADLIRCAVDAGGWAPSTPVRSPYTVYKTLLRVMDVPVKVFWAKARILDERRGVLSTYDGRWHLASECLHETCCGENAAGTPGPLEPVTPEQIAFMQDVLAREPELRAKHSTGLVSYDLHRASSIIAQLTAVRDAHRTAAAPGEAACALPPSFRAAHEALRRIALATPPQMITTRKDAGIGSPRRRGCRFEHGTWIHYPPHTCPGYVRGER